MDEHERVARVRAVFDDWAMSGKAEGMEAGHGFAARSAFSHLGLAPGSRYLDLGCGNGYTVRWASEVVGPQGRAVGLDLSDEMVARAQALSGPGASFHQAAFPAHPFEPASFDAIFTMEVLYYLPDLGAALQAVHDLLAPGGRVACVVDYYAENEASHEWPADLDCPMTLLPATGWRSAFEAAGLEVPLQEQIRRPLEPGEAADWKASVGSLFTLGVRPG